MDCKEGGRHGSEWANHEQGRSVLLEIPKLSGRVTNSATVTSVASLNVIQKRDF